MLVGRHPTPDQAGKGSCPAGGPSLCARHAPRYTYCGGYGSPDPDGSGIQILGVQDPNLQIQGVRSGPPVDLEMPHSVYIPSRARVSRVSFGFRGFGPPKTEFWTPRISGF